MFHIPYSIENMYIYITNDCQLSCEYCNHCKDNGYMSLETANSIIKIIENSNVKEVIFFGGEPLLNFPVLKYFIEQLSDKVNLGFTTNAIELKNEIAQFLAENLKVRIQISIDPDMKYRTNNFKNIILKNITNFIKLRHQFGGCVEANSVVDVDNYQYYIENFYFYLTQDLGFDLVNTNLRGNIVEKLGNEIEKWLLRGYRPPVCAYDGFIRAHYEKSDEIGGCFYCKAGIKEITLGYNGIYYACYQFHNYRMFDIGNIKDGIDDKKLKEWFLVKEKRLTSCLKCDYFNLCKGACGYQHYLETGDLKSNGLEFCNTRKSHFDMGKKIYKDIMNKGNIINIELLRSDRLWTGYNKKFFEPIEESEIIELPLNIKKELDTLILKKNKFNIYPFQDGYFTLYSYEQKKLYKIHRTIACVLELCANHNIEIVISHFMKKNNISINQSIELIQAIQNKVNSLVGGIT